MSDLEQVLFDHTELRARALGRVVALGWFGAPRGSTVKELEDEVAPFHEQHRGELCLVVLPLGQPPSVEARRALDALVLRIGPTVVAGAALLPVSGLKGKLVRAAAQGIVSAMRLPFPLKLVETHQSAAAHARETLSLRALPAPPQAALETMLDRLAAHRARRA